MALLMQPGELLGDRCAQLLVAILIVITTLQNDIGLGNLSYLIWVDFFNLMQLMVLLIALAQALLYIVRYMVQYIAHYSAVHSGAAPSRSHTRRR